MQLTIGQSATLACILEATAPKPGNVHRSADFDDATLNDFLASAVAIGPAMEEAQAHGVGRAVLAAISATKSVSATNTNLGAVLLLAPIACVPAEESLEADVRSLLQELTSDDAGAVYEAIRLAQPGGLGESDDMDIAGPPPDSLLQAMELAADRDIVARQYANGFAEVLREAAPAIVEGVQSGYGLPLAIVHTQMLLMSRHGDSLIARKCGVEMSQKSATMAQRVLVSGPPTSEDYHQALSDFDFWLRADGHRRNPGSTADLIAAALFVCLRENRIGPPFG